MKRPMWRIARYRHRTVRHVHVRSWPAVYLPPRDFAHPVRDAAPSASAVPGQVPQEPRRRGRQVARLQQVVTRLEDERDIEILQRTYGYYVDKNLWAQIAQMFTADGTLEIGGRGVFVGRQRVQQYLEWLGNPVHGRLYDHTQMQPVIHVSPEHRQGPLAGAGVRRGLWRYQRVRRCVYENEYRKVDGKWMISKLYAWFVMYTDFEQGLGDTYLAEYAARKSVAAGPAAHAGVRHVSRRHHRAVALRKPGNRQTGLRDQQAARTGHRHTGRTGDAPGATGRAKSIEYLHNAWGYYLDRWQWDEAADLFADDGSIEFGQRGVYVGKSRVRQSLDLFGPAGLHQGEIFDHAQYQPGHPCCRRWQQCPCAGAGIQHGRKVRRGRHDWRGDLRERIREGQRRVEDQSLHQYTTFIADYDKGWSQGPRPSPGISASLPPDRRPSVVYQSFPIYLCSPSTIQIRSPGCHPSRSTPLARRLPYVR